MSGNRNNENEKDVVYSTNILNAPKINFKNPAISPIPLLLNDSYSEEEIESIEHDEQSYSELPTNYSIISEE